MEVRQEDHALRPALPMYKGLVDERECRKREKQGERERQGDRTGANWKEGMG